MKKAILFATLSLCISVASFAQTKGDVTLHNNNLAIQSNDKVQFKLAVQPSAGGAVYTNELPVGHSQTFPSSTFAGSNITSLDIYIRNVTKNTEYLKCATVEYSAEKRVTIRIQGYNDGSRVKTNYKCEVK